MSRKGSHRMDSIPQRKQDAAILGRVLTEKGEPGGLTHKQCATIGGIHELTFKRWYARVTEEDPGWKDRVYAAHLQKLKLKEAKQVASDAHNLGEDIERDFKWVLGELKRLLQEGQNDDDRILQLASLKETSNVLTKLATMLGLMRQQIDVNIDLSTSPQWLEMRQIMLRVFEQHPEALPTFKRELSKMRNAPVLEHDPS